MAYGFTLNDSKEFDALLWIANRYDYAQVIIEALHPVNDEWEAEAGPYPAEFTIAEHKAWAIKDAIEAEDGYLPCLGGRLVDEVQTLLGAIV